MVCGVSWNGSCFSMRVESFGHCFFFLFLSGRYIDEPFQMNARVTLVPSAQNMVCLEGQVIGLSLVSQTRFFF